MRRASLTLFSTLMQARAGFLERSWVRSLAPPLIMMLILLPPVSVAEIYRTVGRERFRAALLVE